MRIIALILVLTVASFAGSHAYAQGTPQKTWETNDTAKKTVRPLNLKSILRGGSSSSAKRQRTKTGPVTRNPVEALKTGAELPVTQALSENVDYNALRDAMRRSNSFAGKSKQEAEFVLANVRAEEQRNIEAQMTRRNEFYLRHGMSDEHTKAFLRTKSGKLARKVIRKEQREEDKMQRAKERVLALKQKNRKTLGYESYASPDDNTRSVNVVVPTARPTEGNKVKPFFYR